VRGAPRRIALAQRSTIARQAIEKKYGKRATSSLDNAAGVAPRWHSSIIALFSRQHSTKAHDSGAANGENNIA